MKLAALLAVAGSFAQAQTLGSLKRVKVPDVPNLERYVRDGAALAVLGKALFWDMQVGSDNRTACATCHFHAGADHRATGQLSNPNGAVDSNHQLAADDFPFHVLRDVNDNRSAVLRDSGQRAGSAGVVRRMFAGLTEAGEELFTAVDEAAARQATARNTPTVINSVFNVRNFFDGRASNVFTGRTPFGDSDPRPNALAVPAETGEARPEFVRLTNSSLASQAVAPPVNPVEMSYEGRTWEALARKLLGARPLARQRVAADDSVLGPLANADGRGLATTYLALAQAAFQPAYWEYGDSSVMENNFPIFFGLAIQAYERTLVADDSPFDRFSEGDRGALDARQFSGFLVYQVDAFCQFCHAGPEFSKASVTTAELKGPVDTVLTGIPGSLRTQSADTGFFHTGVRPNIEDGGLEGVDDFGVPFSIAARTSAPPVAIAGAFKTPSLRNIELTGPYFQNGGQATLEQVVEFYARGGDFPNENNPAEIIPFPITAPQRADLVAFLKSLTDDRVRYERAPFDHPELCVPNGSVWAGIPAVGRQGNGVPLQTFDELLRGVGTDGSRAHTLTDACTIP